MGWPRWPTWRGTCAGSSRGCCTTSCGCSRAAPPTSSTTTSSRAILKGWLASSGIIGTKVGPMSQGSGLVLLFHNMGEHDGSLGSWAFHKGGNGGFTQVVARAAQSFGAEIMLGAEVEPRSHQQRAGDWRGAEGRHRAVGQGRCVGGRSAAHVHAVRGSPRASARSRRQPPPLSLPGHVVEGQLRARRPAALSGTG